MSYLDYNSEELWQKRLFEKLTSMEDKINQLLVLQEQAIDTTVHPPLKPEYLDIIDVSNCSRWNKRPSTIGFGLGRSPISKPMDDCFSCVKR